MPVTATVRDDADFANVPPGSIPASRSGVYRADHFDRRPQVYAPAMMQEQKSREHDQCKRLQMQQQIGCSLD